MTPEIPAIGRVIDLVESYGDIDGAHHKQWLIDQMIRELLGDDYESWREAYNRERRETGYAEWNEGIAP